MADRPTRVDFHFDVICPWAYQTSLWMRDVRDRQGLEVDWRFFSLEEINLVAVSYTHLTLPTICSV